MDSLNAELNTALQCDREAEDEVKKLKVRLQDLSRNINLYSFLDRMDKLFQSSPILSGAHGGPEAAHRGPVQRPSPVPVPGGEAAAGEAEDGGAQGADPSGRAQGPAVRGDLSSAEGRARDRGQAQRTGPVHSAPREFMQDETS